MKNLVILFFTLIMFFYLIYDKYKKEYFNTIQDNIKIKFNINDLILWNHNNFSNVEYKYENILFNKTNGVFYSNQRIFNEFSKFNGLIFKPKKNTKNLSIGFQNIEINELENKELDNLQFSIKLIGNNFLQIIENNEPVKIDYCSVNECNDKYKYHDNDILGINIIDSKFNFFILKKTELGYAGLRLHRSNNIVTYPIFACILNKINSNTLSNIIWTRSHIIQEPSPWYVEYISKLKYDKLSLPPKISMDEEIIEAPGPAVDETTGPATDESYSFERGIIIFEAKMYNNDYIIIKSKVHNITQEYLDEIFDISIKLTLKDDNTKSLFIPIKNDLFIFNENENRLNDITLNLDSNKNYFYRKEITSQIILRRSKSLSEKFNIESNIFDVIKV